MYEKSGEREHARQKEKMEGEGRGGKNPLSLKKLKEQK